MSLKRSGRVSMRRSFAITRNELRVLRRDPSPLVFVLAVPVLVTYILRGGVGAILQVVGYHGAPGADFAVPAQIVTFIFFIPAFIGMSFIREHVWATWDRLRASSATSAEILIGKVLPMCALGLCQLAIVFSIGLALGLHVRGSTLGVALVAAALVLCVGTLGLAVTSVFKTMGQINAFGNVGSVALAGLGGALMPLAVLPSWVHHIAPATPQYWAMRGFNSLILDGDRVSAAFLPVGILVAFAAGFSPIALWRLRFGDSKHSWA
jgi:ABC-2 type transport system permease protein